MTGDGVEAVPDGEAARGVVVVDGVPGFVRAQEAGEHGVVGEVQAIPEDEVGAAEHDDHAGSPGSDSLEADEGDQDEEADDGGEVVREVRNAGKKFILSAKKTRT